MVCKLTFFGLAFLALTCFNPCYVGLWSVRVSTVFGGFCLACFNPCYVGLWSVSNAKLRGPFIVNRVSILVMLDYGL
mgnify:CR=1 FL=1